MAKADLRKLDPERKYTSLSDYVGMKAWDDNAQKWGGVVCKVVKYEDNGEEGIIVYDAGSADTQVGIDDWIEESIRTKPWERDDDRSESTSG